MLAGAPEAEQRAVGTAVHLLAAELHHVVAARDVLPDRLVVVEVLAALIDVGELHGLSDLQRALVGLLLAHDHAEERGLASAVRPDDAHDAAARQVEGKIVEQELVAVGLLNALRPHHDVAEAGARRNLDLGGGGVAVGGLLNAGHEFFVAGKAGFVARRALALAELHPLELAGERLLSLTFFFWSSSRLRFWSSQLE